MKIYLPTNPLWYFAILVLIVPFFAVQFISPVWVVRFIAFSALFLGLTVIELYWIIAIHKTIKEDAPLVKRYGKKRMIWVVRIFLITFGFITAFPILPSLIQDGVVMIKGDAPVTRVGVIVDRGGGSFTGYFIEHIILDNAYITLENEFSAPYFPSRYFEIGKTYEILYIPYSRIILDAKLR